MHCNLCGREICINRNVVLEDYITIKKNWGYFSKKDGVTQEFVLCETCVDKLEEMFVIPTYSCTTSELI